MKNIHQWLGRSEIALGIVLGIFIGGAVLAFTKPTGAGDLSATSPSSAVFSPSPRRLQENIAHFADLGNESASADVRYMADWVADSHDAAGSTFVIVDKKNTSIYVFDGDARLVGSAPVLLGLARGDETVPDIGSRPIDKVLPGERTTAAGRFVGERGHDTRGEDVVWVDYDAALSMHRVITTNPQERRLQRLATPTNDDNRISYGCINIPAAFYEAFIRPAFASHRAIVYVLPEVKSLAQVFNNAYDVAAVHHRNQVQTARSGDALMLLIYALRSK